MGTIEEMTQAPEEAASAVLSEEEVTQVVNPEEATPEEVVLPSDQEEFVVPEKFQGKSPEEIVKAYMELEKKLGQATPAEESEEKGGDSKISQEGETREAPEEEGKVTDDEIRQYAEEFLKAGQLSEESLNTLKDKGISEETIQEYAEFIEYKQQKVINQILEPLGGGVEKFNEVAAWAKDNKSEAEIQAFNEALAKAPLEAQRILIKGLYAEYDSATDAIEETLHTNTPQKSTKGVYQTQEEFFKDIDSEEYKHNPAFRAAVEAKMARSSIF